MSANVPANLPVIVKQIKERHAEVELHGEAMLNAARACGELLITAKESMPHGKWLPWLKSNFRWSQQTADTYVAIAGNWEPVAAKLAEIKGQGTKLLAAASNFHRLPLLSLRDAVKIARPPRERKLAPSTEVAPTNGAASAEVEPEPETNGHAKSLIGAIDFNPPPFKEPTAGEKLKQWNRDVEEYARKITALKKEAPAGPWWDDGQQSDVAQVLASAAGTARGGKCAEVCPLCNGKGCKPCRQSGFVPNLLYQNMVAKR